MNILVVNAGSTSLKCKLLEMPGERELAACRVERIGDAGKGAFSYSDARGARGREDGLNVMTYIGGLARFFGALGDARPKIDRVGFKTVLAEGYYGVHQLTGEVLEGMRRMMTVAPAHNGPYLAAIAQLRELLPDTPFIGAFETAFHETIPLERRLYGAPLEWSEKYGLKRMGYHGASHEYSARFVEARRGGTGRMISCHLGGSGSLCAILDGKSVDTSFGLSLQSGLIQSSRVGDMDSFAILHLLKRGLSADEIEAALRENGGLKGISGISGDLRDIEAEAAAGNERARLAVDVYVNGIVRYAGAFAAELGGLDCLTFTGGIGENSALIRRRVCESLRFFGARLDEAKNEAGLKDELISAQDSPAAIYVIAADEELIVARKAFEARL